MESLIFQLLDLDRTLSSDFYKVYLTGGGQSLPTEEKELRDLLCKLIESCGQPLIIVVDGVDEIDQRHRARLLESLLETLKACVSAKLLLSSRDERDIIRILEKNSVSTKVDENNGKEIQDYVRLQEGAWLEGLRDLGAQDEDCVAVKTGLDQVIHKAKGEEMLSRVKYFCIQVTVS